MLLKSIKSIFIEQKTVSKEKNSIVLVLVLDTFYVE